MLHTKAARGWLEVIPSEKAHEEHPEARKHLLHVRRLPSPAGYSPSAHAFHLPLSLLFLMAALLLLRWLLFVELG